MFQIPQSLDIQTEVPLESTTLHRINLFGMQQTIQDRIHTILTINERVFSEESWYIEEILSLSVSATYQNEGSMIRSDPPKIALENQLTKHMLRKEPTIHHILFQNPVLGGHPHEGSNLISMEHGLHTSFHQLLDQKNLYPHQHLSKIFRHEKNVLAQGWREKLIKTEQRIDDLFRSNPYSVYKYECFHPMFRGKIA